MLRRNVFLSIIFMVYAIVGLASETETNLVQDALSLAYGSQML